MLYALLVTLREGLEAALLVAVILGYLRRTDQRSLYGAVWAGAGSALLVSVLAGVGLQALAVKLSGAVLETLEGVTMLAAVAVLTWMLFWMKRQAASLSKHLQGQVEGALRSGGALALALLAFSAVGREGLETVLFLFAGSSAYTPVTYWLGGAAGLLAAAACGYVLFTGVARLPLRPFFNVTGVLLIVLSAGLLVGGLKELNEARIIPTLGPHVWDTYALLPDNSTLGRLLTATLGYDSSPRLAQVAVYVVYLAGALLLFFTGRGHAQATPPAAAPSAQKARAR